MRSSEARKEYSRLRSIARKRIDRLQKAGVWSAQRANRARLSLLTPTKYVAESDLAFGIRDLSDFLYKKASTLPAAREEKSRRERAAWAAAQTLNTEWGLGISDKDMKSFGDYMDWLRKRAVDEIFDSGDAVADFEKLRSAADNLEGVDVSSVLKDFKFWVDKIDKLESVKNIPESFFRRPRGKYGQTSRQLRNALRRFNS